MLVASDILAEPQRLSKEARQRLVVTPANTNDRVVRGAPRQPAKRHVIDAAPLDAAGGAETRGVAVVYERFRRGRTSQPRLGSHGGASVEFR